MSAPPYVPTPAGEKPRRYESPPWRSDSWVDDRPAHLAGQPSGPRLGSQGPDQGFVLRLFEHVDDEIVLAEDEHRADVVAGCAAVALKRASLFGRAPVIHDVRVALTVWGHLAEAPAELVERRKPLFAEAHHIHHYMQVRAIADQVPAEVLRLTPAQVTQQATTDWRALLTTPVAPPPAAPLPEPEALASPEPAPPEPAPPEPAAPAAPSSLFAAHPEPTAEPDAEPAPAPVDAATTAELDLVHQAREILEATAEVRHADDVLPTRHHYDLATGEPIEATDEVAPGDRQPVPPRPVRTEDITSLVAEAKGALRAQQLEQAKRNQEAVAAQRKALEHEDEDADEA